MAFKKFYKKFKKSYRRYKKANTTAKKALAIATSLQRRIRPEMKQIDVRNSGDWSIGHASDVYKWCLNVSQQGTAQTQRIGDKINMMYLAGGIQFNFTTGGEAYNYADLSIISPHTMKWWIVLDKQSNGLGPDLNDLYENYNSGDAIHFRNRDYINKYKILKSGRLTLDIVDITPERKEARFYIKFKKPIVTRYDGNTGTSVDLTQNALWFITYCNHISAPDETDICTCALHTRISFTDC